MRAAEWKCSIAAAAVAARSGIAAHGQAGREADERAVALARVLTVMVERIVQVAIHIPMSPMGNVTVDQLPDRIGISFQIVFERDGRLFDAGEDF